MPAANLQLQEIQMLDNNHQTDPHTTEAISSSLVPSDYFGHCDSCGKPCDGSGRCPCGGPVAIESTDKGETK